MSLVTPSQLEAALDQQKRDGRRLGTILVDQGVINETRLVKALSQQLGIDVCDPITAPVHEMVRSKISRQSARDLRVVPIALKRDGSGERLFVATSDPLNAEARRRLQGETSMRVEWLLAGETELELALARHYGTQRPSFVLESLPPSSRGAPAGRGPADPDGSSELDLEIQMESPIEASLPPDVSDALQPILDELPDDALHLPSRSLSNTPRPDLVSSPAPGPARRFTPAPPQHPSSQPSWGEIVARPPTDPSAVLLGPHRVSRSSPPPPRPLAPARPSDDPYIESVEHIAMTGDLLPPSRILRSSAAPALSTSQPFGSPLVAMPSDAVASSAQQVAPSADMDELVEIEEVGHEQPLLELSEAEILPPGTASDVARLLTDDAAQFGLPPEFLTQSSQDPLAGPRVSDLSGLELENIASLLSESVEGEDPVALMVSSPPPPQPTVEQEVRMVAAQVRQEMRDLLAGEANAEARARVLRTIVALLEDEGFFTEDRLQRAVRRALFPDKA